MTIPTNQDFASEVKFDRLRMLWRVTLIVALLVGWVLLNIAMLQRTDVTVLAIPVIVLIVGTLVTRGLLGRGAYIPAAWIYVLSLLLGLGSAMAVGGESLQSILPFGFPVVTFVVGLLLMPAHTMLVAVVASVIIVAAPVLGGAVVFAQPWVQGASILLTLVGAALAAQVSSDLYQIAEWSLSNYQRERRIAGELFDSQQALERSLARSTALGERLGDTNRELVTARATAEEAKHFRGQFLANMSHELRTPLNAIIGFSETMLKFPAMYDEVKLPSAYEDDLQQIYTSGRQLLTLINDILDLAKVDAGKLEIRLSRVELEPLLLVVSSTAAGLVGNKPITLEIDVPEDLPTVRADESRVRQVMLNLYSNAAKFTERGSISLRAAAVADGVQISLTDTGSGISQDNLEIIFEEFKQAETDGRDPRSGAGLGLAITRQLLTLMGGRVWAESELGRGSTFHVFLPAYEPAAVVPSAAPAASLAKVAG